jgi:hypothetical protein
MDLNAARRPSSASEMREMLRDADQYEHLAEVPLQPVTVVQTDVLTQKTKLMPATTRQGNLARTEVLPTFDSELTAIRPNGGARSGTSGQAAGFETQGGSKRFGSGAIAASVMLLAVLAGAAAYMFVPTMSGDVPAESVVVPQPAAESVTSQPAAGAAVADAETSANVSAARPEVVTAANSAAASAPQSPPAKSAAQTQTKAAAKSNSAQPEVRIVGDTVYMGNMKITDKGIVTPGEIIDENGVRRRVPGTRNRPIPPLPPDVRYLTPEQLKKIEIIRQKAIQDALRPTPTPQ